MQVLLRPSPVLIAMRIDLQFRAGARSVALLAEHRPCLFGESGLQPLVPVHHTGGDFRCSPRFNESHTAAAKACSAEAAP